MAFLLVTQVLSSVSLYCTGSVNPLPVFIDIQMWWSIIYAKQCQTYMPFLFIDAFLDSWLIAQIYGEVSNIGFIAVQDINGHIAP